MYPVESLIRKLDGPSTMHVDAFGDWRCTQTGARQLMARIELSGNFILALSGEVVHNGVPPHDLPYW